MAVVHQKGDPVLLGGYGIILGDLNDLDVFDLQLIAPGRPLILVDFALNNYGRLLRQVVIEVKDPLLHIGFGDHTLDYPCAIPDQEEPDLPAGSFVIDPAVDSHLLPIILGDLVYVGSLHGLLITPLD